MASMLGVLRKGSARVHNSLALALARSFAACPAPQEHKAEEARQYSAQHGDAALADRLRSSQGACSSGSDTTHRSSHILPIPSVLLCRRTSHRGRGNRGAGGSSPLL